MNKARVLPIAFLAFLFLGHNAMADEFGDRFQYSVKAVCTFRGEDPNLGSGRYNTAINVHNPRSRSVTFKRKAVVAVSESDNEAPDSAFKEVTLKSDHAVEIACNDILSSFCPINGEVCVELAFFRGFVVIKSPVKLDVIAVYTASSSEGQVSIDVETIKPGP
jgi:hypothetical protein